MSETAVVRAVVAAERVPDSVREQIKRFTTDPIAQPVALLGIPEPLVPIPRAEFRTAMQLAAKAGSVFE
jgi:hypothetical protein